MELKIMSWNMAGAKVLEYLDPPKVPVASSYIDAFKKVWKTGIQHNFSTHPNEPNLPDIILLQECIGFVNHSDNPSDRWYIGERIFQEIFPEYDCYFFPAFSSHSNPHPGRWKKYEKGRDFPNYLPSYVEAQQGYGICIRKSSLNHENKIELRKIWVSEENQKLMGESDDLPKDDESHLCFEAVTTTSGLYLGNRDTEPRLAVMGRAKVESPSHKVRYVNFLNIHLTTLKGERDGNIRINRMASKARMQQIDLILNNVISAYHESKAYRMPRSTDEMDEDIWIVAGDFNATENSEELLLMRRMGFIDGIEKKELIDASPGHPHEGKIGTKRSIKRPKLPPVTVDYILCGLERSSFGEDECDTSKSHRPLRPKFENPAFESDHAVLFTSFQF